MKLAMHRIGTCPCGSGLEYFKLRDGYGAFLCIVCEACKAETLSRIRPDIMERYPRPSWFDVHMELNPTADPDEEWRRLTRADRNDFDRTTYPVRS